MSEPPRVLLVVKGLDIGGIERIVVDLACGLAGRGVPVEVAVVNEQRAGLRRLLDDAGIVVHDLGGSDRLGLGAARRLVRLARTGRFDVVHVHGPMVAVPLRLARLRASLVTTAHTPLGALRRSTRLAWRATAGRDAATVAVSVVVAASMPRRVAERVRVIPHGLDPAAVVAAHAAASRPGGLPGSDDRRVVAVTVASHRRAKNYPNLLRALRVALDAGAPLRLVAVGTGPGLGDHERLADELGVRHAVTFVPPTPEALAVVAGADFLVVASDYEGQPLVVTEALALGRPVVATAVGRVPELVTADVGRVVAPGDPVALGAALAELAGDAELRRSMAGAAQAAAAAWTLDDVLDAHLDLYGGVTSTR